MESVKRSLSAFVFIAGLMTSSVVVFGALRSKMTGVVSDASDVTWAHAVNSRDALEKALAGPVDFLEADLSLGHVVGNEQSRPVPVMAHPPDTTSDISLDTWLNTVVTTRPEKGIKLDFKSIDVVEPSLIILRRYSSKLNSSVWLNADVLSGPINSTAIPVSAEKFLVLCHQYFPDATLSTGWTTTYPTPSVEYWHYGWQHVREMADVIKCRGFEGNHPKFTFPVRGIFASRSIQQLRWLLSTVPNSTLTVWSGKHDPLQPDDLHRIRAFFPKDKVYYDVPDNINHVFQERKSPLDLPTQGLMSDDGLWMTFTRGQGESCSALTYVRNGVIVFGKSLATAVLRKNVISVEQRENLKVTGKIKFFVTTGEELAAAPTTRSSEEKQEFTIVLADVSAFAKKSSPVSQQDKLDLTVSDTDVIWSAMNSSAVYTLRHNYGRDSSCRLFRLDTTRDKSFEVWTVPCDAEGSLEEMSENGIPEISPRKRLVLPTGPFMLGFVSAGDDHAVLYDLEVETHRGGVSTSASEPVAPSSMLGLFAAVILLLCVLCL